MEQQISAGDGQHMTVMQAVPAGTPQQVQVGLGLGYIKLLFYDTPH